jgi:hypothetical protein
VLLSGFNLRRYTTAVVYTNNEIQNSAVLKYNITW